MRRTAALGVLVAIMTIGLPTTPATAHAAGLPAQVIVKLTTGIDPATFARTHDAVVTRTVIGSRRVFLLSSVQQFESDKVDKAAGQLADAVRKDRSAVWADVQNSTAFTDERFHAWPFATPTKASDAAAINAPVFDRLHLAAAQQIAMGTGAVVAVLDTGVSQRHPQLSGSVIPGYDFVSDDGSASEQSNGIDDDGDGVVDAARSVTGWAPADSSRGTRPAERIGVSRWATLGTCFCLAVSPQRTGASRRPLLGRREAFPLTGPRSPKTGSPIGYPLTQLPWNPKGTRCGRWT